ncbi:MAG: protein kinase domain-containing protein [Gemmatimonadaceae bacterium]
MSNSNLERWRQIESVLDAALDLPEAQRSGFLDRRCAQDDDLREHVEQLLRACDSSEHFLEQPVAGEAAPFVALSLASADLPAPGARVGAYRIIHEAGRGGMGVVYLAERDDGAFRKRVALKLVRRGASTGDLLTRRFHDERQILASLDHPGIARLIDGGALPDGRPYFVMEYVEGTPIDRFCDDRGLDVDARLELFCKVCDAVQHAHEHQIIHRDLKPTNLLVKADATVKLLDFGIATLLTPDGSLDVEDGGGTPSTPRILTPEYASPEQVRGEAASAASDVYSLGVVLYELLAGRHPFRNAGRTRSIAERRSLEHSPVAPSEAVMRDGVDVANEGDERSAARHAVARRRSRLAGALDDIVLTALRKEPARRYPSAGALAADVRRHLGAHAAGARSRGWPHRVRAFAGRHPSVAIVLVLGAATVAALAGVASRRRATPPLVRASSIAVLPFTPSVGDTLLLRLGRDLVATLSASLNGVGDLRTADAQSILAATNDPRTAASASSRSALARKLGAELILRGSLAREGPRVRADGELLSTVDGAPIAHVSVAADPADLAALTDSIVWLLLRQLSSSRGVPVLGMGAASTRSLSALRAYLEGERLAGEYRMRAAAAAYARAAAADSTFWLAQWREDWARAFNAAPGDSVRIPAYLQHLGELPVPDRKLIEARRTPQLPARLAKLESLVTSYPTYSLARFELGELGVQQAPFAGRTMASAGASLRHAASLDSTFVPALDRLLWFAIAERDTITSARTLATLKRLRYDSTSMLDDGIDMLQVYRYLDHLARSNGRPLPALADSVADALGRGHRPSVNGMPDRLQAGIVRFEFHRARIDLAERELHMGHAAGFQWQIIANGWASRGGWDTALVAVDRAAGNRVTPQAGLIGYRLAAIGEWLGAIEPSVTTSRRKRASGAPEQMRPTDRAELAWLDGLIATARRDGVALTAARNALRRSRAPEATRLDSSLVAFARELAGDRSHAIELMLALERDRYHVSAAHPYLAGVNRISASRWLAASGDSVEAARLLTWHEAIGYRLPQPLHANAVLAPIANLERARLLTALGQPEAARVHYARFLAAYDSPVPTLRGLVAEARAGLARTNRR